jgi:hypothetical protein
MPPKKPPGRTEPEDEEPDLTDQEIATLLSLDIAPDLRATLLQITAERKLAKQDAEVKARIDSDAQAKLARDDAEVKAKLDAEKKARVDNPTGLTV